MQMLGDAVQIMLGVERSHAARAGRGDRLPIDMVLHVAAREHAAMLVLEPSWVTM